jgi:8-oxo-dGTP pyrophosphatase MutT (NUDIX family)
MVREISAGGVVVRQMSGEWMMAAIEPQREEDSKPSRTRRAKLALPKGLVDAGERPEQTALREVREETGVTASVISKLTDIKYVYVRTWGDGERVFKIVSFYLLRYLSGEIDDVSETMRVEVKRALWIPLAEAAKMLAYSSERNVARQAQEYVAAHEIPA